MTNTKDTTSTRRTTGNNSSNSNMGNSALALGRTNDGCGVSNSNNNSFNVDCTGGNVVGMLGGGGLVGSSSVQQRQQEQQRQYQQQQQEYQQQYYYASADSVSALTEEVTTFRLPAATLTSSEIEQGNYDSTAAGHNGSGNGSNAGQNDIVLVDPKTGATLKQLSTNGLSKNHPSSEEITFVPYNTHKQHNQSKREQSKTVNDNGDANDDDDDQSSLPSTNNAKPMSQLAQIRSMSSSSATSSPSSRSRRKKKQNKTSKSSKYNSLQKSNTMKTSNKTTPDDGNDDNPNDYPPIPKTETNSSSDSSSTTKKKNKGSRSSSSKDTKDDDDNAAPTDNKKKKKTSPHSKDKRTSGFFTGVTDAEEEEFWEDRQDAKWNCTRRKWIITMLVTVVGIGLVAGVAYAIIAIQRKNGTISQGFGSVDLSTASSDSTAASSSNNTASGVDNGNTGTTNTNNGDEDDSGVDNPFLNNPNAGDDGDVGDENEDGSGLNIPVVIIEQTASPTMTPSSEPTMTPTSSPTDCIKSLYEYNMDNAVILTLGVTSDITISEQSYMASIFGEIYADQFIVDDSMNDGTDTTTTTTICDTYCRTVDNVEASSITMTGVSLDGVLTFVTDGDVTTGNAAGTGNVEQCVELQIGFQLTGTFWACEDDISTLDPADAFPGLFPTPTRLVPQEDDSGNNVRRLLEKRNLRRRDDRTQVMIPSSATPKRNDGQLDRSIAIPSHLNSLRVLQANVPTSCPICDDGFFSSPSLEISLSVSEISSSTTRLFDSLMTFYDIIPNFCKIVSVEEQNTQLVRIEKLDEVMDVVPMDETTSTP